MSLLQFNCVLLIDDDGVTNFINHRLIRKLAITASIESAINGSEALKFLHEYSAKNDQNGPELILLDINMPVLDGFEFLDQFEKMDFKNKDRIRIIVLTTSTHQKDIIKISSKRHLGYINKPLTPEKLVENLTAEKPAGAANG